MRRSLVLRTNPTVRQTQLVLARLERALAEHGAAIKRPSAGEIEFRMPAPWKLAPGFLALVSGGTATVSAWGGGPWRVSYSLRFGALRTLTAIVTLALVTVGWGWPRLELMSSVIALWVVGSGTLHILAARAFRRFVRELLPDVIERRAQSRQPPEPEQATAQQPD
jgi:hypothetical protein